MFCRRISLIVICGLIASLLPSSSPAQTRKNNYIKRDIVQARYGDQQRQAWVKKAYQAKKELDRKIIGQERNTFALQEALIQYGESFGTRTREPVALHFIGLPGIGKSALVNELTQQGFLVKTFNMQNYDASKNSRVGDFGPQFSSSTNWIKSLKSPKAAKSPSPRSVC